MQSRFDLEQYLTDGVRAVLKDAARAVLKDPAESRFLAKYAVSALRAEKKRADFEKEGLHVPTYLICSITSACNLHCAGCYSRAGGACTDEAPEMQLTAEEWDAVFTEASGLGVSFILLAGGEPLLRADVIKEAARHRDILFPVFTNGTLLGEKYLSLFRENRNLVPVLSLEGGKETTDLRRGEGIYGLLRETMEAFSKDGILFGASITVTKENMREVTSDAFLDDLEKQGCKVVIFVEYVPVEDETEEIAPGDEERMFMQERLSELRTERGGMVYIAFPGDEKLSDGCLAAGRGFFHINSHGGAEPCPFSPYSDCNVKELSLRGALRSPLFRALQEDGILMEEHKGGCTLHARRAEVEALLARGR